MPNAYQIPLPPDKSFDPQWLVDAIRAEYPHESELIAAAERVSKYDSGSSLQIYFLSPTSPNEPGSAWQYAHSVHIEKSKYGELAIDIMKDGCLGGIEFLDNVYAAARFGWLK